MRIILLSTALLASSIVSAATPVDGWYASAFGGYTYFIDNIYKTHQGSFYNGLAYKGGYNVGGRIGYQSNPIRYEAEYTYMHATLNHFDANYVTQTGTSGYTAANLLMANIYYDFPDMLPAVSPYLGAGIGYAALEASLNGTGPLIATRFTPNANAFAYQGTAGITYNFSENYAVNLAYRYVATGKNSNFGRVFQAHVANAGVVYRFDQGTYK